MTGWYSSSWKARSLEYGEGGGFPPPFSYATVKTTRKTGGLHKPYKGLRQAAPKGAVKRSADRI